MPRTANSKGSPRTESFEDAATQVLGNLRGATGLLIEALPGPIRGAADIQRVLGLDWALSWQLYRVGSVSSPVEAGPDVPRKAPLTKALKAAAEKGVAADTIARVEAAFAEFERLVEEHAGDRGSFDSMVRALRQGAAHISVKERRAAYRSMSGIWGVHADVRYHCGIAHPGERKDMHSSVILTGYIGLRKLRPGAPVIIGSRSKLDLGTDTTPPEKVTVDTLTAFCSQPVPSMVVRNLDQVVSETLLEIGPVGKSGAITHILRRHIVNHVPHVDSDGGVFGSSVVSRIPTETMVLDLLVPTGWSDPRSAAVATYGNLHQQDIGWRRNESDRMPVEESIEHIGNTLDRLQTPLVPRCPEMIDTVIREAGWGGTPYDIYRCVVEYPILHACIATRVSALAPG